ncbi:hypothetical protein M2451_003334 [Dysgonomonas sp. PFB1-18]|uniref:hypothetical protein n=1 Tax=unclassified Dysgonomonas TaxID=2630389 RepID=UPI002475A2CD|nr:MULTISPECIES: hypothetical protein [unclassified Dysgonomonas]MDH6310576.1 hypothetical protein [Dysgonomonas sp. PF1-14]MDH6340426.1 hypothetical protein [Dysgonomonas sp. PF1-16]MDH6381994.1 hypothetical protein [Dysgonomonas sp. PFB1-18]MDH6399397.1 hypothetical protein [Dysgonomonas sp. PF1-23]
MAYNNRNKLLTVKTVQELVLAGQKRGATQKWVYENEVNPVYPMSYSTFNNYLSVNVRLEQEKTEKRLAEKKEAKQRAIERRKALLGCQLSIEFI